MNYRSLVGAVLLLPVLFLAAIAVWDPLGVLWRSEPKAWVMGMRVMAVCAIDSGKYDSYVLGTSMLENTSARELEKVFPGSHFANISIRGSNFYVRSFPLQRLLSNNKTKRVVYSLDTYVFVGRKEKFGSGGDTRFLYDNFRINNAMIYFNAEVIKDIIDECKIKKTNQFYIKHDDYNMPTMWYDEDEYYKRFGGLKNWVEQAILDEKLGKYNLIKIIDGLISVKDKIVDEEFDEEYLLKKYSKDIKKSIKYCEKHVLKFVRNHADVDFYMIFPPYSIVEYAMLYQSNRKNIVIYREVVRYFVKMADSLNNLHVYGYNGEPFTEIISDYMDTTHYRPEINSKMVIDISQNRHMLSSDNVEAYLEKGKKAALDFDLRGFSQKVEDYLESMREK